MSRYHFFTSDTDTDAAPLAFADTDISPIFFFSWSDVPYTAHRVVYRFNFVKDKTKQTQK